MYHLGLGLVLFSVLAAPGIVSAAEASFCDGYAEQAAHDAALAERFACDFHGDRWLKDIDTHRTWCRGATQATVEAEAAARTKDLRLCMCQWYADTATAQAERWPWVRVRRPALDPRPQRALPVVRSRQSSLGHLGERGRDAACASGEMHINGPLVVVGLL